MSCEYPAPGCCVERECLILSDDFDREEIGGNWNVISGTWAIESHDGGSYLVETSGNGKIVSTVKHPMKKTSGYLSASLLSPIASGGKQSLILGCDDEGNGGQVLTCTGGQPNGNASINGQSGWEFPNLPWNEEYGEGIRGELCYTGRPADGAAASEVYLPGTVSTGNLLSLACGDSQSEGYYIGFTNESGAAIKIGFSEVNWYEHCSTNTDPDCPECPCHCDRYCLPTGDLRLTVESSCEACDGISVVLPRRTDSWCAWGYDISEGDPTIDSGCKWGWVTVYPPSDCGSKKWTIRFQDIYASSVIEGCDAELEGPYDADAEPETPYFQHHESDGNVASAFRTVDAVGCTPVHVDFGTALIPLVDSPTLICGTTECYTPLTIRFILTEA